MSALDTIQSFCNTFTDWQIAEVGTDTYVLSSRIHNQGELSDYNPEHVSLGISPNLTKGAYAPFCLSAIRDVAFDGKILTFKYLALTFSCDGAKGTINEK